MVIKVRGLSMLENRIMQNIKSIIFDVDGVLIDSLEGNHKFYTDLMKKFGYEFMKLEEFISHFHLTTKDVIRHSTKLTDEKEIEKIWLAGKNREVPYPEELLGIPKNLKNTIEALSKKYVLGVATSRTLTPFSITQLIDLEKYFKAEVIYGDTKNHKPHPEPLILAAQKLGLKPEECVYVGDSATDLMAARDAGMKCIIIESHGRNIKGADENISSFEGLIKTVDSL